MVHETAAASERGSENDFLALAFSSSFREDFPEDQRLGVAEPIDGLLQVTHQEQVTFVVL